MSRPYSYATRFVTGFMDPNAKAIVELLDTMDHGRDGHDLLLRQKCPFPDTQEGRLTEERVAPFGGCVIDGANLKDDDDDE
jgi:hypothetical protein